MKQLDHDYARLLITRFFNVFNGQVNALNYPAQLIIDFAPTVNNHITGIALQPNVIVVYPTVIWRVCEENNSMFICEAMNTVIHELFHVDQFLNPTLLKAADKDYVDTIEAAVNCATANYIRNNLYDIANIFGYDNKFIQLMYCYMNRVAQRHQPNLVQYKRINMMDHVHIVIEDLLNSKAADIISSLISNGKTVVIEINNKQLRLSDNGVIAPINDINEFFWNYSCRNRRRIIRNFKIQELPDKSIKVSMDVKAANNMCNII